MQYIVELTLSDWGGDDRTEIYGPFREPGVAETFADKVRAKIPNMDEVEGSLHVAVRPIRPSLVMAAVGSARQFKADLAEHAESLEGIPA